MRSILPAALLLAAFSTAALAQAPPSVVGGWIHEEERGEVRVANFQPDGAFCVAEMEGGIEQELLSSGAYRFDGRTLHFTTAHGNSDANITFSGNQMRWHGERWTRSPGEYACSPQGIVQRTAATPPAP